MADDANYLNEGRESLRALSSYPQKPRALFPVAVRAVPQSPG